LPASVELTLFSAVDAQGQPTGAARIEVCRSKPAQAGCSFTLANDRVVIEVAKRRRTESYLVLGVEWFVPVEILNAAQDAAASDALKYTFRLRPSPDGP